MLTQHDGPTIFNLKYEDNFGDTFLPGSKLLFGKNRSIKRGGGTPFNEREWGKRGNAKLSCWGGAGPLKNNC